MEISITLEEIKRHGLSEEAAQGFFEQVNAEAQNAITAEQAWQSISQSILKHYPFSIHLFIYTALFPNYHERPELAPAWLPDIQAVSDSNLSHIMAQKGLSHVSEFHQWSVSTPEEFWQLMIKFLDIHLDRPFEKIGDWTENIEAPIWLPGAKLNIVDSCFQARETQPAIIYTDENNSLATLTYTELEKLTNRVANGLLEAGYQANDRIAIIMPMNVFAVAIYLGIIRMGGIVVSIADSFTTPEILDRCRIAETNALFIQDYIPWGGKRIPLYDRIKNETERPPAIVLTHEKAKSTEVGSDDIHWKTFLSDTESFSSHHANAMDFINILFSSGTTAHPKAIPWTHASAIKAASDACLHQNVKQQDRLCWPTNLGWMMGPWLIFAALINKATLALYTESPKERAFGEFVSHTQVTMLGVVPTLVHDWRQSKCMEGLDWQKIKVFSSTGECSNQEDMLYLMSLGGYKPIIEYCGGTEIGGAYLSSTLLENNCPSLFSSPVMGIDFKILNEKGEETDVGEVAIIAPAFALSNVILNADHHQIYYQDMPVWQGKLLRRHGDQIKHFENGYYMMLGRIDDAMNLGGIKVSSAEIERVIAGMENIEEVAAVGVAPAEGGPARLIIFAVTHTSLNKNNITTKMQNEISKRLNPLFKIHDLVFVEQLPKTATNKIMRRSLREQYQRSSS